MIFLSLINSVEHPGTQKAFSVFSFFKILANFVNHGCMPTKVEAIFTRNCGKNQLYILKVRIKSSVIPR